MMKLSMFFPVRPNARALAAILLVSTQFAVAGNPGMAEKEPTDRAASENELREFCKTALSPCRENLRVMLRRDDGATYDKTFDLLPPAVQQGMITVHPGETVQAVPLFEKGEFSGWRAAKPDEPAGVQVLTIRLEQMEARIGMQAHVKTNTGPALKLRMGLMRLDSDEPESTSSCPLMAGGGAVFEMWPYPIFMLLVADAEHTGNDDMVCR